MRLIKVAQLFEKKRKILTVMNELDQCGWNEVVRKISYSNKVKTYLNWLKAQIEYKGPGLRWHQEL